MASAGADHSVRGVRPLTRAFPQRADVISTMFTGAPVPNDHVEH